MSLAVLKKKTRTIVKSPGIYGTDGGFRLNNKHVEKGGIGKFRLLQNSFVSCSSSDVNTGASTVRTHAGYSRRGCCVRYPNHVVQTSKTDGSQGLYIADKKSDSAQCVSSIENDVAFGSGTADTSRACLSRVGTRLYYNNEITKSLPYASQGDYLRGAIFKKKCLPTIKKNRHFPMNLTRNGCNVTYMTWEDAVADGALPPDYRG